MYTNHKKSNRVHRYYSIHTPGASVPSSISRGNRSNDGYYVDAMYRALNIQIPSTRLTKAIDDTITYLNGLTTTDIPNYRGHPGSTPIADVISDLNRIRSRTSLIRKAGEFFDSYHSISRTGGVRFPDKIMSDFNSLEDDRIKEVRKAYNDMNKVHQEFDAINDPVFGGKFTVLTKSQEKKLAIGINNLNTPNSSNEDIESYYRDTFYTLLANNTQVYNGKSVEEALRELRLSPSYNSRSGFSQQLEEHFRAYFSLRLMRDMKTKLETVKSNNLGNRKDEVEMLYQKNTENAMRRMINSTSLSNANKLISIFQSNPRLFSRTNDTTLNAEIEARLRAIISVLFPHLIGLGHGDALVQVIMGKPESDDRIYSDPTNPFEKPELLREKSSRFLSESGRKFREIVGDKNKGGKWRKNTGKAGDWLIEQFVGKILVKEGLGGLVADKFLHKGSGWVNNKVIAGQKWAKTDRGKGFWNTIKYMGRQSTRPALAMTRLFTGTTAGVMKGTSLAVNSIIDYGGKAYDTLLPGTIKKISDNKIEGTFEGMTAILQGLLYSAGWSMEKSMKYLNEAQTREKLENIYQGFGVKFAPIKNDIIAMAEIEKLREILSPRTLFSPPDVPSPNPTPPALPSPPPAPPPTPPSGPSLSLQSELIRLGGLRGDFAQIQRDLGRFYHELTGATYTSGGPLGTPVHGGIPTRLDIVRNGIENHMNLLFRHLDDLHRVIIPRLENPVFNSLLTPANQTMLTQFKTRVENAYVSVNGLVNPPVGTRRISSLNETQLLATIDIWKLLDPDGLSDMEGNMLDLQNNIP